MRILLVTLLILLVFLVGQVQADPLTNAIRAEARLPAGVQSRLAPQTVVAQSGWPSTQAVTLLVDACDGSSMRAQWVTRDRTVIWGCWGYNPTGVQVAWSTGRTEFIDWFDLWHWNASMPQQLGYQRLHERVLFLRNTR